MTSKDWPLSAGWILESPPIREYYRGRNVLVLGATGFLGWNCVRLLNGLGARVTASTRTTAGRARLDSAQVAVGDLADADFAFRVIEGQDVVFDFVGVSGPVSTNLHPADSVMADCIPQVQIAKACAQSPRLPFLVFCSSRLVYGHPRYLPVDEAHPLHPGSIYAVNKVAEELYLRLHRELEGLRYCAIRLSNPFGPHPHPDWDAYGVLNQFIRNAVKGKSIRIFGDGAQRRDYIYVDDVIAAFLLAPTNHACTGEVFNLGGAAPIRIASAVKTISRLAGNSPVEFADWPEEYRKVETGDYLTDLSKIERLLDFRPRTSFEEGIRMTVKWHRYLDSGGAVRR